MNFAFYGSLRDPDVLYKVAGPGAVAKHVEDIRLKGFKTVYVKGYSFPVVVQDLAAYATFSLYKNLDPYEAQMIRAFEDDGYVETTLTHSNQTYTYFAEGEATTPSFQEWSLEEFQSLHKEAFLKRFFD